MPGIVNSGNGQVALLARRLPEDEPNILSILPNELILRILGFLDIKALGAIFRTCGSLYEFRGESTLWRGLCFRDISEMLDKNIKDWKTLYRDSFFTLKTPYPGPSAELKLMIIRIGTKSKRDQMSKSVVISR